MTGGADLGFVRSLVTKVLLLAENSSVMEPLLQQGGNGVRQPKDAMRTGLALELDVFLRPKT